MKTTQEPQPTETDTLLRIICDALGVPLHSFPEDQYLKLHRGLSKYVDEKVYPMPATQEKLHVKIWLAADKQSELGYWPISQSAASIWEELKAQGHDGTGTIIETTADWSADMSDEILENQPKKGQTK